jgi:outer membrane lipoprotein carrier protein
MYVERPGRMRWDYLEPERKIAVVNDGRTTLYLVEDEQLIRGRLDGESDLLPTLLAGDARLAERFDAMLLATPEMGGEGAFRLRLAPPGADEAFEQVVLTVRPPRFEIESVEVLDAVGNRILYRFTDLRRNAGLPSGLFAVEPPPGVEISGSHHTE